MKKMTLLFLTCILLVSISCKKELKEKKAIVFVSILPQKYFVEKIAGDLIDLEVLVGPGKSPETYEPTPQLIMSLGEAKALFTIGVSFEKALLSVINNNLKKLPVFDTLAGIEKRTFDVYAHDHEETLHDADVHSHKGEVLDPHIWLSPALAKLQAKNILNGLLEIDPQNENVYKTGYDLLIEELDIVHDELSRTLKPFEGSVLFVFHPAFGYFADEFGLKQVAIETGGKEPALSVLQNIIMHAREENVKIIFVQPEFSKKSAQKIAKAIGGSVVVLNPLDPDYINNLRKINIEVEKALLMNNK